MSDPITTPTPAPAPVASPAPPPAPTPVMPAQVATPSPSGGDDPFEADFAAEAHKAVDTPAPAPSPKAQEPTPAPKVPDKPAPKPAAAAPAPKPPEGPKELRAELERVRAERDTFRQQHADLEKRIAAAEARGKDTAALAERAAVLEKTIAEREAEVRMLKQEASPEFKAKFETPFNDAAEYAREVIGQLTVSNEDEVGNKTTRPATWDDFASLYSQPYSKAIEQATTMFGPAAQVVINHLTELHRLDSVRARALKNEREQAGARMKEDEGRRVQSQEAAAAAMAKLAEELPQKFEAYRDPPEDKELSTARAKGFEIFDAQPKSPQQAMIKFAHVRQRVAAHGPLLIQNARLKAEVARLQAELDGKTTAEPESHRRAGGTEHAEPSDSWDSNTVPKELANVT